MTNRPIFLVLAAEGQAPEWLKVLPLGTVELRDGRPGFDVTPADLEGIITKFRADGVDLVVDYEHQTLGGGRAPAAGWIKDLEARADGLYARVDWTLPARQHIEAEEYRYYSPVVHLDPETRRPVKLRSVGLVNDPAIRNLAPLLAAKYGGEEEPEIIVLEDVTMERAAQLARSQKYGIGIKSGSRPSRCRQWAGVPEEQWGDPVNWRFPIPDPTHKAAEVLTQWGDPENRTDYTGTEQSIIDQRIRARAKAVGMTINEEARAMKNKLVGLLALKAEATEEEVLAALKSNLALAGALPEIGAVLGLKAEEINPSTIKGAILALKQGQEQLTQLQMEVTALKQESAKAKAAAVVEEALKAGKLQPSQREWALELASKDMESFSTFIAKAPVVVPRGELKVLQDDTKTQDGGLTPEEMLVCKSTGVTPEAFKAEQKRLAEQAG